jgi:hypothetical protein
MKILSKALLLVSLACITTVANAQTELTHIKTDGYDAYSISAVNTTDSTFNLTVSALIEGNDINIDETYNHILFNQIDSIMYSKYGDQYDDKAKEELHKQLLKNMKKKDKEDARKNKKLNKELKKSLRKELKTLKTEH